MPSDEFQTFTLVPMVADFLRRKKPEVVAETGDRLEKRAYALIVENGYENHERFPVFDAAWPSVSPALPRFLAGPNDRLQTVCDALFQPCNFTGRYDESLSLNQQAEAKAVVAGDHDNAGWRARDAGWTFFLRGQADEVLACADRVAKHWQSAQAGAVKRGTPIYLRGLGHRVKNDYPSAIAHFREALELWRTLPAESVDVVNTLIEVADVERLVGNCAAAERDYREALRVADAVGHAKGVAAYTGKLAELELVRNDWKQAEALAREALSLSEKLGRQELIAVNCRRIAMALVRQGKGAEGLPYSRRAVDIYTRLGSPELETARATLRECESQ